MGIVQNYGLGYAPSAPTEAQMLVRRKEDPLNGTVPLILGLHGHGGGAQQFAAWNVPTAGAPVYHVYKLVEAGFMVLSLDEAGGVAWSDQAALDRINDGLAWAAAQGVKTDKIGVMGWSMGGLTALNWIKRNPTRVGASWLWTPASDLDFFHDAGYVASYNMNGIAPGQYTAEIDAAYGGSASYVANSAGFHVHDEPQSWRGIAPIQVAAAPDDATIPHDQSVSFVAAVNDPLVTFRDVPQGGGHTNFFTNVPWLEVIQHFQRGLTLPH